MNRLRLKRHRLKKETFHFKFLFAPLRILRYIRPELGGRPCILVANKTDLVRNRVVRTPGEHILTGGLKVGWVDMGGNGVLIWWPMSLGDYIYSQHSSILLGVVVCRVSVIFHRRLTVQSSNPIRAIYSMRPTHIQIFRDD